MSHYIYNKENIPDVNSLMRQITHLGGQHPDTIIHMPEDIHGCDEPLQLALRELSLLMKDNAEIAFDLLTAAYKSRNVEYVKNGYPGDYFSVVGGVRYAVDYFKKFKLLEENIRAGRLVDDTSSQTLERDLVVDEESASFVPGGPTSPRYAIREPSTPVRSLVRPRSPSFCPNSPVYSPREEFQDHISISSDEGSSAAEATYDQRNGTRKRARPSEEEDQNYSEDEEANQRAKRARYRSLSATGDEEAYFIPQHRAIPPRRHLYDSTDSLSPPFQVWEQSPLPPPEEPRKPGRGLLARFNNVVTQAGEDLKTMSSLRRKAKEYKAKAKARKREVKAYERLLNAYKLEAEADKMEIKALRKELKRYESQENEPSA